MRGYPTDAEVFRTRTLPLAKAPLVIDVQYDCFPGGKFPLWNTEAVLPNVERAVAKASASGVPVVHVQHVAPSAAPFFHGGRAGADIHPRILAAAPTAPVVVKAFADSPLSRSLTSRPGFPFNCRWPAACTSPSSSSVRCRLPLVSVHVLDLRKTEKECGDHVTHGAAKIELLCCDDDPQVFSDQS